jgi:anti-sigma-K factor RskA
VSPHRDEHLDLCAAQVLGVLDDAGRVELEAHLASGCEVCAAELRGLSGGATVLALSVPQHRAPARVRQRVLEAVRAKGGADAAPLTEPAPTAAPQLVPLHRRERPAFAAWAWAAAAVLLAVAGVYAWRRGDALVAELEQARAHNRALQQNLEDERRWAAMLEAPETRVVKLAPTPEGDATLAAQVLYDPVSRRAIVAGQRFAAPQGREYELWAITASGPTSLGVVRADASGRALARLEHVGGAEAIAAFAFSLEATGGSPDHHKPSGPIVMVGKLAS